MGASIDVVEADLADETQVARLFEILDAYARGPGGQNAPLSDRARENLGPGLREHPMAFVLFGRLGGEIVEALERRARDRDAAKLTLEVVGTNEGARRLYERFGFAHGEPPTHFMTKSLP